MAKDVLDVWRMARQHIELCAESTHVLAAMDEAHDRIAELIAADVEYDEIHAQLFLLMLADPRRGPLEDQLSSSRKRRAAALAACRGL